VTRAVIPANGFGSFVANNKMENKLLCEMGDEFHILIRIFWHKNMIKGNTSYNIYLR
jgi:hypothetical protein